MWKPVSTLPYRSLSLGGQVLVVADVYASTLSLEETWGTRACAVVPDVVGNLRDVVRDVLANPQVRAIVFMGTRVCRAEFDAFWSSVDDPGWKIRLEDLALVRRFVDLYDDDFGSKGPMQPFWPARIIYADDNDEGKETQ